jgi:hypothetical protein
MARRPHARTAASSTLAVLVALITLAGCAQILEAPPAATPADFPGIASELAQRGITIDRIASGDAGCPDPELARTAIRFIAAGLDQAAPVTLYVYIFRDRATYDRRRQSVDACARTYVTDPQSLGSIDASPFVVVGQGPWAPRFAAALRSGLTAAAAVP